MQDGTQLLFDRESRSNLNWRKWMLIWMQKWAVILLLCVCVCDCIVFRHLMRQSSIKGDLKPVCVNCRKDMKSSRIDWERNRIWCENPRTSRYPIDENLCSSSASAEESYCHKIITARGCVTGFSVQSFRTTASNQIPLHHKAHKFDYIQATL